MEPRLEASVIEPRVTMTKSVVVDLDLVGKAAALVQDAIHTLLAGFLPQDKIGDASIQLELHLALRQPLLKRPDHRVVLVVDRAHDPVQPVEAGDHVREPQQDIA